ncbi:MAG: carbon-nitrogen hydrolase family protein [Elusimicrobia bacterium]|nr:carbon-nitrogen hydrolase family protein [Elusimicrobiota bacterium]
MKEITVCGVQMESRACDIGYNIQRGAEWIEKCRDMYKPHLVVFPETVTTGFNTGLKPKELYELIDDIPGKTTDKIQESARKNRIHVVWTTYERAEAGRVYNSSVLIGSDGRIVGIYRKIHPFPAEEEWTMPGDSVEVYDTEIGKIGMMICFDGDFAELARIMGIKGADVITRPSAFLRSFDTWKLTNTARAYDSRAYIIATNQVGKDAGDGYYYGHSMIVDPLGRRIAQALCREEIVYAVLEKEPLKYASYGSNILMPADNIKSRRPSAYKDILN